MMKNSPFLLISIGALLLASCSSNPASRIKKNPTIYSELTPKHQDLVSQGQIEQGMTKPAVFLAMGRADSKHVKVESNQKKERWNYNSLQPVYRSHFSFGYGHGYGGYGRGYGRRGYGRGGYYGLGYSPSVSYVPRVGSSVYFEDEKVSGWEGSTR